MTIKLSVNLNAIAVLRNRRNLPWPNIIKMGRIALNAGADGLTVHPRPDERHIRFRDLADIRKLIDEEFPHAEFNIEGYPTSHFLENACTFANQITLVPDSPTQSTSDHGWDFIKDENFLSPIIHNIKKNNIRVSLFADPTVQGLEKAKDLDCDRIEFYTGPYGDAYDDLKKQSEALNCLVAAAQKAKKLGLGVNAGHDLTVENLPALVKAINWLDEVSIGHGLIADALEYGMIDTVKRFKSAIS
ncbi:pyridoxine 5'-phosphate synthase [Bartonella tamiae]|uniref:Pyridoxine 5'-phosphate synthase n=1 Tax=Bartonella tamiae Th239 TaxID=1094558 RepID=J0QT42_9HYPH|nr:pyridoxine 5'-phosphate synthase [Bartonella tamiae]EJF89041.1 pyridoxine 5'-phosphate synthase [Bartonella tamiae Th239]EJF94709.1 pyridoxine 5'-phosphate synthase [Bartonella tamiae Th307]